MGHGSSHKSVLSPLPRSSCHCVVALVTNAYSSPSIMVRHPGPLSSLVWAAVPMAQAAEPCTVVDLVSLLGLEAVVRAGLWVALESSGSTRAPTGRAVQLLGPEGLAIMCVLRAVPHRSVGLRSPRGVSVGATVGGLWVTWSPMLTSSQRLCQLTQ